MKRPKADAILKRIQGDTKLDKPAVVAPKTPATGAPTSPTTAPKTPATAAPTPPTSPPNPPAKKPPAVTPPATVPPASAPPPKTNPENEKKPVPPLY